MILPSLVLPLIIAMLLALIVTTTHRWLPPVVASWVVIVTLGVVAVAAVPTLWIVTVGYLAHAPVLGGRLRWCAEAFGAHQPIPIWLGMPALVLSVAGLVRVAGVVQHYRQLRRDNPGDVEIAEHSRPFAFTLPGRGGHVVLSSGLVSILDDDERGVVLAHERAHARNRHDRFLFIAQLAAALVPFLRPLAMRVHFSLERCADEVAVQQCGDRAFVARTLGKVALHGATPVRAMSFAGLGVPARVAALLSPPRAPWRMSANVALWTTIAVTAGLGAFQIHHLARLVAALCHT